MKRFLLADVIVGKPKERLAGFCYALGACLC
jgi:hypothetical protein